MRAPELQRELHIYQVEKTKEFRKITECATENELADLYLKTDK